MKNLAIPFEAVSEKTAQKISNIRNTRQRWISALLLSSASGVLVGLTGLLISGLNFFGAIEKTSVISHLGTLLIVIAFPLVMFGAHAMDKIGEIDRMEKQKRFPKVN